MFRFASPLFLLLAVLPAAAWYIRTRQSRSGFFRAPDLGGMAGHLPSFAVRVSSWLPFLKAAAIILMILALARPQVGEQKISVPEEGINIILALDLSGSMAALDFKQDGRIINRLEAVKSVARDFIARRETDRIGVVVFGTHAFTQLPLTRDYQTITFVLDRLEIGAAGPETAIGDAIGISLKRLQDVSSRSNVMILLTDGKSNAGRLAWQDAARIAGDRNVRIHTIGVGTGGQAPFPVDGPFGRQYVYRQVDTDPDALKEIAARTGGTFFEAGDLKSLQEIYRMIDSLEKTEVTAEKWVEYREFYPVFLFAGLLLLLIHILLANTRFLRIP